MGDPLILLAEDYALNQKLVTAILQFLGHEVLIANDGKEAVSLFEKHKNTLRLILMDIKMPHMNGMEATRKIRSLPDGKNIPIIALTASAIDGDKELCLESGMSDYMTKPVSRVALEQVIQLYVGNKQDSLLTAI